jgi:hypothetical protein
MSKLRILNKKVNILKSRLISSHFKWHILKTFPKKGKTPPKKWKIFAKKEISSANKKKISHKNKKFSLR